MAFSQEELKRMYPGMSPDMAAAMAVKNGGAPMVPPPAPAQVSVEDINSLPSQQVAPMSSPLSVSKEQADMLRAQPAPAPQANDSPESAPTQAPAQPQTGAPWGMGMGPQVIPGMSRGAALKRVSDMQGEWNVSPEDKSRAAIASSTLDSTREQKAEATAAGMEKQADVLGMAGQDYADRVKAFEQHQAERQKVEKEQYDNLTGLLKKHDEMKLSDNPYWDNRTSGGKIMAMIGMIGAGIASGLGNNSANQFISQQIQNSIDTQKEKIAKSREGINQARGLYSDLVRQGYDAKNAELLAMEMGKQKFWNMAKEYGAKTEAAKANIDTKAIEADNTLRQANIDIMKKQMAGQAAYQLTLPRIAGGRMKEDKEQNSLFVPALGGYARTIDEAKDLRNRSGAIMQIQSNLKRAAKLRKEIGKDGIALDKVWSDPRVAELESIIEETKPRFSVAFGQGAAGEAESARYATAMGNLMNFRGDPSKTAEAAADRLGSSIEMLSKTSGITKGVEGFAYDPSRNGLKRVGAVTGEETAKPALTKKVQRTRVGD